MKEITREERTIMEQGIKNQIWFDFVKKMYLTAVYKVINNAELFPGRKEIVDITSYVRFIDFEATVGESAVKNLKSFVCTDENLDVIDVKSLSDEEIIKLDMVISMFPFQHVSKNDDFDLSSLLVLIVNELRTRRKTL